MVVTSVRVPATTSMKMCVLRCSVRGTAAGWTGYAPERAIWQKNYWLNLCLKRKTHGHFLRLLMVSGASTGYTNFDETVGVAGRMKDGAALWKQCRCSLCATNGLLPFPSGFWLCSSEQPHSVSLHRTG
jgi:hypothetical protein